MHKCNACFNAQARSTTFVDAIHNSAKRSSLIVLRQRRVLPIRLMTVEPPVQCMLHSVVAVRLLSKPMHRLIACQNIQNTICKRLPSPMPMAVFSPTLLPLLKVIVSATPLAPLEEAAFVAASSTWFSRALIAALGVIVWSKPETLSKLLGVSPPPMPMAVFSPALLAPWKVIVSPMRLAPLDEAKFVSASSTWFSQALIAALGIIIWSKT